MRLLLLERGVCDAYGLCDAHDDGDVPCQGVSSDDRSGTADGIGTRATRQAVSFLTAWKTVRLYGPSFSGS